MDIMWHFNYKTNTTPSMNRLQYENNIGIE
jgi:hypothetical protein